MKRVIRYLRFSNPGQSNSSIEAQQLCTDHWIVMSGAELVDTFIDVGKSARTFDRPDFTRLQRFVSRHCKSVDYLLVDQLDRFSRNAGDAMNMVKELQLKYSIQIVSVTEGITFDYNIPGNFFRAGLQFLLAEEDNINRSIKIRKGIYTAKAHEGRFLYKAAPFGYRKIGEGKERHLVIDQKEARLVKFIFDSYLHGMPLYMIKKQVGEMGFDRKGNVAVERILKNPVYAGMLEVKSYDTLPGGLFPAVHEAIVDREVWEGIQKKRNKVKRVRTLLNEDLPLRGVLKCHCGKPLTGAPSRGKSGRYFYYYKCPFSKHNNISVVKAHDQLLSVFKSMNLSKVAIDEIMKGCRIRVNNEIRSFRLKAVSQGVQKKDLEKRLLAVEEKWIMNEIDKESYEKWHLEYSNKLAKLNKSTEELSYSEVLIFRILEKNYKALPDIARIYTLADLLQKRELIRLIFDDNLYYQQGSYKTYTVSRLLQHNLPL